MSRVPSQSKYLDWLKKDHIVEIMTPKQNVMNKEQLKEITNHNASCFEMTKERECEGDIFETQRTILVPQKNGTEKKKVVKYQMANITTMTRTTSENDDKSELGKRKQAEAEKNKLKRLPTFLITCQERMKIHRQV